MKPRDGYRVLPWPDWVEWLEVKDLVDKRCTQQAQQRVNTFVLRRSAAVPIAMLSTVSLMSQLDNPSSDSYTQRLGLSMAITRLVNGTTDRIQPRGERSVARSVASLATELGMPLTLVDIRHQACHNVLPSLSWLTDAACDALVWLKEWYWEPQLKNVWKSVKDSTYVLAKVFRDELSAHERKLVASEQVEQSAHENEMFSLKDSEMILEQMNALSNLLERSIPKVFEIEQAVAVCPNNEDWKAVPFGLAPGQRWVPRKSLLPVKRFKTATHNTVPLAVEEGSSTKQIRYKRRKTLGPEEELYFKKMVAEFQHFAERLIAEKSIETNQPSR